MAGATGEREWGDAGTSLVLPLERDKASFDAAKMAEFYYGGAEGVKKRRFILLPAAHLNVLDKHEWSREELIKRSLGEFIKIHKDFVLEGYRPTRDEVSWMGEMATLTGSAMPSFGLFLPTIMGQGSSEQVAAWLPRALRFEIVGCYAQTELSHGSNVRALQTTATYDRATQEFVLHTPSIGATKWWNSNVGLVATHAAVYAQLLIEGKEYGLHVFFVQVRDEQQRLLPGIEAGDCGPKLGDDGIDTGYIRFDHVRIPREHLMAKRQHVEADGSYVKHAQQLSPKQQQLAQRASYLTMMQARSGMTSLAAGRLSIACTIAVRYSCVRSQGFSDTREGQSFRAAESQVLDYGVQRHRVLKQVAICVAMRASGSWMNRAIAQLSQAANETQSDATEALVAAMPEVHASSAGLKGVCCKLASDGMEDLRKACGGHGYLLSSGIASLASDFVWQVSAEGDFIVLLLQTARFLVKSRRDAIAGRPLAGLAACLEPLRHPAFEPRQLEPPAPRTPAEAAQLDYLLRLFQFRAVARICDAGARLDRAAKQLGSDAGFNSCAVALRAAAEAHIHYFMLRNFVDVIRAPGVDTLCASALHDLCALFALQQVQDGAGWAGLVGAQLAAMADDAVEQLLDRLRPDAVALVDAFQIPDRLLGALGRSDGKVYEELFARARDAKINDCNRKGEPFYGYSEVLEPHLDKDFLALRGKACDEIKQRSEEQASRL